MSIKYICTIKKVTVIKNFKNLEKILEAKKNLTIYQKNINTPKTLICPYN